MVLKFIPNEYPGYCVLITFFQTIKALNMSFNQFKNHIQEVVADERIKKWWDDIYKGKVEIEDLKRQFFRENEDGQSMYDLVDPFVEQLYEIQNGMNVTDTLDKTTSWNVVHKWDNEKMLRWYNTFKQKCEEVPFVVEFLNFKDKKLYPNDHVYVATMQDGLGDNYKIRNYNSDREGVIEQYTPGFVCPLIYGYIEELPEKNERPEYLEKKPGGIGEWSKNKK